MSVTGTKNGRVTSASVCGGLHSERGLGVSAGTGGCSNVWYKRVGTFGR